MTAAAVKASHFSHSGQPHAGDTSWPPPGRPQCGVAELGSGPSGGKKIVPVFCS